MKDKYSAIDIESRHGLLHKLAEHFGTTTEKGYLKVPKDKGSGYLKGYILGNSISMLITNCELNDDLLTRRSLLPTPQERIIMSFNNVLPTSPGTSSHSTVQDLPSVQIGKGGLPLETFYPSHTRFKSIVLSIDAPVLKTMLGAPLESEVLKTITDSTQAVIFEAFLSPQIQEVAVAITTNDIPEALHSFYFRIKAEELICLLFAELSKRDNASIQPINEWDATKIYLIRDKVLSNLSVPPLLDDLVKEAAMSKSKLKSLFKQVFGESIFRYYQNFRMREAARLLKERKCTVSEVGYQMGFQNLSHFSRVFEEHMGTKPKKYALRS